MTNIPEQTFQTLPIATQDGDHLWDAGASPRTVTLDDVARMAGVTKMTVSNVLNGKRPSSRHGEKIRRAVRELNYEPNPHARRLRNSLPEKVVALYSPVLDPVTTVSQMQHMQTLLNLQGFDVEVHAHPYMTPNGTDRGRLLRRLRMERPCALVCNMGWNVGEEELKEVRHFQSEGGVVACLTYSKAVDVLCDQVDFDYLYSIEIAAQHLIELGHTKIGITGSDFAYDTNQPLRLKEVLDRAQLDFRPDWVFDAGKIYSERAGAILAEQFLAVKEPPTALLFGNMAIASVFINTVQRSGLSIPHDVNVIGFEDSEFALYAPAPITGVTHAYRAQSGRAIEMLLERLNGLSELPRRDILHGELVIRDTTAPHAPRESEADKRQLSEFIPSASRPRRVRV